MARVPAAWYGSWGYNPKGQQDQAIRRWVQIFLRALGNANDAPTWPGARFLSSHRDEPMLNKHQLKTDLLSLLLIGATPSATQSPSDTKAAAAGVRTQRRGRVESDMQRAHDFPSWMSSGGLLTTARAAAGMKNDLIASHAQPNITADAIPLLVGATPGPSASFPSIDWLFAHYGNPTRGARAP